VAAALQPEQVVLGVKLDLPAPALANDGPLSLAVPGP
jgi:hypothetical protein